jgi:hypothetical protein
MEQRQGEHLRSSQAYRASLETVREHLTALLEQPPDRPDTTRLDPRLQGILLLEELLGLYKQFGLREEHQTTGLFLRFFKATYQSLGGGSYSQVTAPRATLPAGTQTEFENSGRMLH